MPQFWAVLTCVADVLGVLTALPMLAAAGLFLHRARRYRQRLREMEGQTTPRPVALAVSLTGLDISEQVRGFLAERRLPGPVRVYCRGEKVNPAILPELLHRLTRLKNTLSLESVTEVHLFYAGPVALGIMLGGLFHNWVPVKVYHLNSLTGQYEFWGVIGASPLGSFSFSNCQP
ncbi:MAG: SAVED domain-containing protein [Deltaproteobacteria bacterium]|nr:SAVED domain-containing protein [Deltaproteobacteria bacterium]